MLLLVSCGSPVKPETPLELNVDNLKGKWVLEGDNTKWYEFKADGQKFVEHLPAETTGTFKITTTNNVQLYTIESGVSYTYTKLVVKVFSNHLEIGGKCYIRQ